MRFAVRPASLARSALLAAVVAVLGVPSAGARPNAPVLHEPVRPDPREDLAMHVAVEGDMPAALQTRTGAVVGAPDLRAPPGPSEATYGPSADSDSFTPDRETRRPDVNGYDDPFTPSTAPFKRLSAFDAVRGDYRLYVHDERLTEMPAGVSARPDDDSFYADLVVDADPTRAVRIPSVAAGARIAFARLAVGAEDIPMRVKRDGADNWFLEAYRPRGAVRARLVMHLVAPRAAFGGTLADPSWADLPRIPPLPENIAREAAAVRSAIGVTHKMRPRAAITRLVEYFRGFVDSDDPPRGRGSIYLDLALSKKGVCRHRAFAFLVTALGLGIPTRMVLNEAHAWVEVHDGALWRRIDLGGAGRMTGGAGAVSDRAAYEPPVDAMPWPVGAVRGGDLMGAGSGGPGGNGSGSGGGNGAGAPQAGASSSNASAADAPEPHAPPSVPPSPSAGPDDRPATAVTLAVSSQDAHSGQPLVVRGEVRAGGEPCAHVAVELWLRSAGTQKPFRLGTLATGDDGAFSGGIVVPTELPLGDYDILASTAGDARCGSGTTEP